MSKTDLESQLLDPEKSKPIEVRVPKPGDVEFIYRVALTDASASVADPSPLGIFAFSISTIFFGFISLEVPESSFAEAVMPLVFFHGGIAQIIAGIIEYKKKNAFGSTCFVTWGCFFMGVSIMYTFIFLGLFSPTILAAQKGTAILYSVYGFVAFALFLMAQKIAVVLQMVFGFASLLFFVGAAQGYSHGCKLASGAFGLMCGFSGLYLGIAMMFNDASGKYMMPVGRKAPGPSAEWTPSFLKKIE